MYAYLNNMVLDLSIIILDSYTSIVWQTSLMRSIKVLNKHIIVSAYGIYSIYSSPDGITGL